MALQKRRGRHRAASGDRKWIPAKTGQDHLKRLQDGRDVYIYGTRVGDVTSHRAFRRSVGTAAALYDFQAQPSMIDAMTFASPDTGRRVNRCWQLPESYTQLVERRRALEAWAECFTPARRS
jgi:4-hydroxyphenylacetate 3-monooxygenase